MFVFGLFTIIPTVSKVSNGCVEFASTFGVGRRSGWQEGDKLSQELVFGTLTGYHLEMTSAANDSLFAPLDDDVPPSSFVEKYVLNGSDNIIRFNIGKNVVLSVECTEALSERNRDSSRVHTHVLSEYKWASEESYNGRILSVHGNLIAYRLFNDSTGEAVRVLEKETRNRHLIKGFAFPTADLQWAPHAPLLAVLDTKANLYVYNVDEQCNVTKYLIVMRNENTVPDGAVPRMSWCPYIPETEEPHELVHMIAVYFNSTVELITLSTAKNELRSEETTIEALRGIRDSLIQLPEEHLNTDVLTVCVSPDATAIAVAQSSGGVSFFIIDGSGEGARFAHQWRPVYSWPIQDLLFLDNIDVNSEAPEQFWKYAIVATDGRRRLDLYESENWKCIARLRFESADRLSHFALTVDPSARFLFVADYDAANVHCVELAYVSGVPHFASCTQLTFCHPLVNVMPYSVTVNSHSGDILSDDDDPSSTVVASLIALSQRSLLQLEFDLESAVLDESGKDDSNDRLFTSDGASVNCREGEANGRVRPEKDTELIEALIAKVDDLGREFEKKIDEIRTERFEDRARLEEIISQMKEEMISRDERMLMKFESSVCENRTNIVEAIQTSLDLKIDGVTENLKTAANQRRNKEQQQAVDAELQKNVREAMMSIVVPALDSLCSNLFTQLNETFRTGLDQYMKQLRLLQKDILHPLSESNPHVMSVTSSHDPTSLIHLIENRRMAAAFEMALAQKDPSALMFVCNNIDPEYLLRPDRPISQNLILCILGQLSSRLEGETDLKFRYIENSLMALSAGDISVVHQNKHVLMQLKSSLSSFMAHDTNSTFKRQTRIILQLINNLLLSPQRLFE
ncbi:hypothetical protein AB6A40_001627 [Gnathostoma spinigerum]|uniref:Enhancer of mRNA-decapping protein 4 n=1 Tax=Gnathostoma spinigerum TaxID=75299 RepID=A0ABD6E4K8_9BILA